MNLPATTIILQNLHLGDELSDADRQRLTNLGKVMERNSGDLIFREGEKHHFVHWIIDGRFKLEMSNGGTAPKLLITLDRGDLVGWSAMIRGGRMTSTATTVEPTRLLAFDANELRELCRSDCKIGYHVMEHFAQQLAGRLLAPRLQFLDLFREPSESGQ